jgi:hypothetical protein
VSARRHFVNELTLAAANVAYTNRVIAAQQKRIARIRCKGGNTGHAEDLLETMLDVSAHHQGIHDRLLYALLTATTHPVMAY